MKEILKFWYSNFHLDLVSYLFALAGLIVSIWKRKQNRKLTPLSYFFLGYMLDLLITRVIVQNKTLFTGYNYLSIYIDFFDTIIEFMAFFFLIKNHILDLGIRRKANLLLPTFLSLIFFCLIYYKIIFTEVDGYFLQVIFSVQASILVIACSLYYVDLFKRKPDLNLITLPSFWAVTGLAFFMLSTLPFSVVGLYLIKYNYSVFYRLYSIFYIFYCILFLMIIKAYFCRPQQSSWQE